MLFVKFNILSSVLTTAFFWILLGDIEYPIGILVIYWLFLWLTFDIKEKIGEMRNDFCRRKRRKQL